MEKGVYLPIYHTGNFYLTMPQMKDNATFFYGLWTQFTDWSIYSLAGILGNAQSESSLNPGIWQNLTINPKNGYGFLQWTPATKYTDWCNQNNYSTKTLYSVILRLQYELKNRLQYYPTSKYPETFDEFLHSEKSPRYLGEAFESNYERPAVKNPVLRGNRAEYWYEFLTGMKPPSPPIIVPTQNRFWWIYYLKNRRYGNGIY